MEHLNNHKKRKKEEVIPPIIFNKGDLAELIRDKAKEYAEKIIDNRGSKDNYTQIRKFYDEIVRIQQRSLNSDEIAFNKYRPSIYVLAAKSSYAVSRKVLSKSFSDFIEKNVKEIKTKDDLNNFIILFEAVLGYLKFYDYEKNKKNN